MYNDTQTVIEILGFVITIAATVGVIIWKDGRAKERAAARDKELDTKIDNTEKVLSSEIKINTKAIEDVKKEIGNGGFGGLKEEVKQIEINCAKQMSRLDEKIKTH